MSIYDTLNNEQKEAVLQTEGPVLILAGAGSGKTRVLTHRIAYMIDHCGVQPWNILAITFTNKAAGEMRQRVDDLIGTGSEQIWVSTFHSTCAKILRRHIDRIGYDTNYTIYDTDDSKSVIKEVCKKLNIDTKQLKERAILSAISSAKNEYISPEEYRNSTEGDYMLQKIAACYTEYQLALRKNNALDFDDLLVKTVELFQTCPDVLESFQERFKYIMVDEYQDTNTVQFNFIEMLARRYRNLCVVGDDDQSIYKFRGANIRNILDFEQVFPDAHVIKLEQNYRSTGRILDGANAVIGNNLHRKQKSLWTDKGNGSAIHLRAFDNAYEEADFLVNDIRKKVREKDADYNDCAVLFRTNAQARLVEERMVLAGVPYNVVGGVNFYSRKEIKDVLAYLKTVDNARDDLAVRRIINVPKRGIGATTIGRIQTYADLNGMSFFGAMQVVDEIPGIGKAAEKIKAFVTMILGFRSRGEMYTLEEQLQEIFDISGYLDELENSDDDDAEDRLENIDEFTNKLIAYETEADEPTLGGFLQEVALVADIDNVDGDDNKVLLMTMHAAKGLEFNHVYLAGMEDGLFPSYMTIMSDDPFEIEEERRLAYVGMTRAKEDLTLTFAKCRMIRGETQYNAPSRFLKEIPDNLMDNRVPGKKKEEVIFDEDRMFSFHGSPVVPREQIFARPKATVTRRGTPEYAKPFALKGAAGLAGSGISKGVEGAGTAPDYVVGDRVSHIKYGEGQVTALEKGERDYKVTVMFDQCGQKIMYAAFAKLKKL